MIDSYQKPRNSLPGIRSRSSAKLEEPPEAAEVSLSRTHLRCQPAVAEAKRQCCLAANLSDLRSLPSRRHFFGNLAKISHFLSRYRSTWNSPKAPQRGLKTPLCAMILRKKVRPCHHQRRKLVVGRNE